MRLEVESAAEKNRAAEMTKSTNWAMGLLILLAAGGLIALLQGAL